MLVELPNDVLDEITRFLTTNELAKVACTCTKLSFMLRNRLEREQVRLISVVSHERLSSDQIQFLRVVILRLFHGLHILTGHPVGQKQSSRCHIRVLPDGSLSDGLYDYDVKEGQLHPKLLLKASLHDGVQRLHITTQGSIPECTMVTNVLFPGQLSVIAADAGSSADLAQGLVLLLCQEIVKPEMGLTPLTRSIHISLQNTPYVSKPHLTTQREQLAPVLARGVKFMLNHPRFSRPSLDLGDQGPRTRLAR
jgi:hypothetical protein